MRSLPFRQFKKTQIQFKADTFKDPKDANSTWRLSFIVSWFHDCGLKVPMLLFLVSESERAYYKIPYLLE